MSKAKTPLVKPVEMWAVVSPEHEIKLVVRADCEDDAWNLAAVYSSYYILLGLNASLQQIKSEGYYVQRVTVTLIDKEEGK